MEKETCHMEKETCHMEIETYPFGKKDL